MSCGFEVRVEPANVSTAPLPEGATFDLDELLLPEGAWNLVFSVQGTEVGRIDNVHVTAGAETRDARLLDFDWRRLANLVTIRLEDEHGQPTDEADVHYCLSADGSMWCGRPRNGVAHVLVPKQGARLIVRPRDLRCIPIPLDGVAGEHVIRIGAGATVAVRVPKVASLPPGAELTIGLESRAARQISTEMLPVWDGGPPIEFNVARPGEYIVKLAIQRGNRLTFLEWSLAAKVGSEDMTVEIVPNTRFELALKRAGSR